MTLPRYDDWLDNYGNPGIYDGNLMGCQCEHTDHGTEECMHEDLSWHGSRAECQDCGEIYSQEGTNHTYLGVPAGEQRAHFVGPICDACADTHMSGYLIRE